MKPETDNQHNVQRVFITMLCLVLLLLTASFSLAAPKGDLIIFHAGSLSIPFRQIGREFMEKYPEVHIYREAAGSRICARKITDLEKPCDVMASADYTVIDTLLIPDFADWNIAFAGNEMAIMYRPDSAFAAEINSNNWPGILLRKGVEYGHSDPNADPCGYRSLITWQLAEKYYNIPGLYKKLQNNCPLKNIRPKETDLMALLESGELDYVFIYRSICEQHKMPFVVLPDEINLKSAAHKKFYSEASIKISGKQPGEFMNKTGKPMVYGITVCKNAPNREAALLFVEFLLGAEGRKIMRENGQPPLQPIRISGKTDHLPDALKKQVQ